MKAMSEKNRPIGAVREKLIRVLTVALLASLAAPVQANESDREWGRLV